MSPDLQVRRRVRQKLDQRPRLNEAEWIEQSCQPQGIAAPIAVFAYRQFQRYSGLEMGRVRLDDRLEADLHWTQICWFDWTFTLCQDFWQSFSIDLEASIHEAAFETIGELIALLNDRWTDQAQQRTEQLEQRAEQLEQLEQREQERWEQSSVHEV